MNRLLKLLFIVFTALHAPLEARGGTFDRTAVSQTINAYRYMHSAPELVVSDGLSSVSQKWADSLAKTNSMVHSESGYGENLAAFSTRPSQLVEDYTPYIKSAITLWEGEEGNYDYSKPGFSGNTGHFTQNVWKTSRFIGVGAAKSDTYIFIVMNFNPPGNMLGAFKENVFPQIQIQRPPNVSATTTEPVNPSKPVTAPPIESTALPSSKPPPTKPPPTKPPPKAVPSPRSSPSPSPPVNDSMPATARPSTQTPEVTMQSSEPGPTTTGVATTAPPSTLVPGATMQSSEPGPTTTGVAALVNHSMIATSSSAVRPMIALGIVTVVAMVHMILS
jgi:hypothetical protein